MKRLWTPIVLAVLVMAFFGHALFGDRIFLHRDLFSFQYPIHHYWVDHVRNGQLPVLNTALNGGQPLFVNPNYSLLYPASILYLVLDFDTAWNLTLVAHVFWAGLGLFYFSRVLGFSALASLSGGMTFAFGGALLSSMTYYISVIGLSWLPWILALSVKAVRSGGRWIAFAGLALGAQVLSGEPNIMAGTATLLLFVIALLWRQTGKPKTTAIRGGAVFVLGSLMACVQIVPMLFWLPHSGRAIQLDFHLSAAYWSLNPVRSIEFIVPRFFGNVMSDFASDYWGAAYADSGYPYILMMYAGWLPLLMAPLACRNRWGMWAVCITVASIVLSFGRWLPGYRLLYDFIPLFQTLRYPEKFLFFAHFGLSVAVAAGVAQLPHLRFRQLWPSLLLAAGLLSVIGVFAFQAWPPGLSDLQRSDQSKALASAAVTAAIAGLLLTAISKFPKLLAVLPVMVMLDLSGYTWELADTESRTAFNKPPELMKRIPELGGYPILHLGEQQTEQYFLGGLAPGPYMKEALHPLLGLNWGVQYGATRDVDRLGWRMSSIRQSWIQHGFPSPEALHLMRQCGIARVISLTPVANPELQLESHIALQGNKHIYVYRLNPPPLSFIRWKQGKGQIQWRIKRSDHISIDIKGSTGGTLIVSRNALPGWNCILDGQSARWKSTREGWLEIDVPPGNHHIELAFATPGLFAGSILTAVGTLLIAALFVFG